METNHLFKIFGKGKKTTRIETNECVVYTRVSSAKQMDGLSLEVQMKGANEYAERHKLIVREYFGGTYESAAKDERKEFQRMLAYLKKTKYKISKILVYSLERFSRNDNSIWLSIQLRKLGIEIISTTQPIDTTNPAGVMQQKMLFMFGEMDNALRRQKCMAGVKEHLIQGEWVTAAPVGYDTVKHNKERKIVANDTGLIIKKMFYWKAKERMPNVEIQKRLKGYGLNYCLRRIGEILTNPFYCGKMVHKALEGEVVDGKHEKIVSEAIFLEANNIMAEKKLGLQTKKERPEIALKRFMKCAACNQPMRGYIANGWDVPYYKCNTPGCKCNRNANEVNNKFAKMLEGYRIDKTFLPLIKEQLYLTFQDHNAGLKESEEMISRQMTDIRQKLERLEERFILEELTGELYNKYKAKFEKEAEELEAQRANNKIEMSKLEDFISVSLEFACNLREMWASGDYTQRQELQNALFEAGIVYDRQKDECRSTGDNKFITEIAELSGDFSNFPTANNKINQLTSVGADKAMSKSVLFELGGNIVLLNLGVAKFNDNLILHGKPFVLAYSKAGNQLAINYDAELLQNLIDVETFKKTKYIANKNQILQIAEDLKIQTWIDLNQIRFGNFLEFINGDEYFVEKEGFYVPLNFINDNVIYFKTDHGKIFGLNKNQIEYEYHFTELYKMGPKFEGKTLISRKNKTLLISSNYEQLASFTASEGILVFNGKIYFTEGRLLHVFDMKNMK